MARKVTKSKLKRSKTQHNVKVANKKMTKLVKRGKITPEIREKLRLKVESRGKNIQTRFRNDGLEGYDDLMEERRDADRYRAQKQQQMADLVPETDSEVEEDILPTDMVDDLESDSDSDGGEGQPSRTVVDAQDMAAQGWLKRGLEGLSEPQQQRRYDKKNQKNMMSSPDAMDSGPRKFHDPDGTMGKRPLLPVKDKEGRLIMRYESDEEEEEEEVEELPDHVTEKLTNQKDGYQLKSGMDFLLERKRLLPEYKRKLSSIKSVVVGNPEQSISRLKDAVYWAGGGTELVVQHTVSKLAIECLREVFIDIIPGYVISKLPEEQSNVKLKKDTKLMRDFEQSLVTSYRKYLQVLDQDCAVLKKKFVNNGAVKNGTHASSILTSPTGKKAQMSLDALCQLLVRHPHFNFHDVILQSVIPFLAHSSTEIRTQVLSSIVQVIREDLAGTITKQICKAIGDLVKDKLKSGKNIAATLPETVLRPFLQLKVKEIEARDEKNRTKSEQLGDRRKRLTMMSRNERKYKKQLALVEREFREAEADENRNVKLRNNTQIMEIVFATYFRVLREMSSNKTHLLPPVLEGMSQFAHLINVEFFDDLVALMQRLIKLGELKNLETLHCIHTVFTILSGEGEALNIDLHNFYNQLYAVIPQIVTEKDSEFQNKQLRLALECLDLMIVRRKRLISFPRVAAFAKQLSLIAIAVNSTFLVPVLLTLAKFFCAHPKLDCMLDSETVGSGKYQPELPDPEHCCAQHAKLFELQILTDYPSTDVARIAKHILAGAPVQGHNQLPVHLARKTPVEVFDEILLKCMPFESIHALPACSAANTKKKQHEKIHWKELEKELKAILNLKQLFTNVPVT